MAGFEKTKLANGEYRGEYIVRRLGEGATVKEIHTEINEPERYSGPVGKKWPESVVYAAQSKLKAKSTPRTVLNVERAEAAPALHKATLEVPPEYEGILTPEDVAEARAEAAAQLRKEERVQAKKDLLAKARADLKRELAIEAQRGSAKGDMVDVTIDLAPYAKEIKLDGFPYEHGHTYRVPRKIFNVLAEQMQRSWQHEGTLHGNDENAYRRPRQATINGRTGAVRGAEGLRA